MSKRPRPAGTQTLNIHDIGPKGDGIARGRHGNVFIERGLPGDEVEAKLWRGDDDVTRGSIERILTPSPHRTEPECPLYNRCGGCSLQHASNDFYRDFKMDIVGNAMAKAGLHCEVAAPIFCPPRTRRRATFAAFLQNGKLTMGYYKRRSHDIVDVPDCMIVHPDILNWRTKITPHLKKIIKDSRPCDVFIQMIDGSAEIVITGPVGRKGTPELTVREAMGEMARETGLARISWRMKWMDEPDVIVQMRPMLAKFGPLAVPLPPNAFLQPTAEGQKALVDTVIGFMPELKPNAMVADLFCGCGTFTGPLLDTGAQVAGFDIGGINALNKAKGAHKLSATERDLFKDPLRREELNRYEVVILDPPRAGCREQTLELARSKVKHAIFVSCNPATFARDARLLIDGGFKMSDIQVVDQFVYSHHVELVAKFTRA